MKKMGAKYHFLTSLQHHIQSLLYAAEDRLQVHTPAAEMAENPPSQKHHDDAPSIKTEYEDESTEKWTIWKCISDVLFCMYCVLYFCVFGQLDDKSYGYNKMDDIEANKRIKNKTKVPDSTTTQPFMSTPVHHITVQSFPVIEYTKTYKVISQNCKDPLKLTIVSKTGSVTTALLRSLWMIRQGSSNAHRSLLVTLGECDPRFARGTQEDSHEAMRCLFDAIKTEETKKVQEEIKMKLETVSDGEERLKLRSYLRLVAKLPTEIGEAMQGTIISTTICHECYHITENYEPFFDISLPMPMPNRSINDKEPLPSSSSTTQMPCTTEKQEIMKQLPTGNDQTKIPTSEITLHENSQPTGENTQDINSVDANVYTGGNELSYSGKQLTSTPAEMVSGNANGASVAMEKLEKASKETTNFGENETGDNEISVKKKVANQVRTDMSESVTEPNDTSSKTHDSHEDNVGEPDNELPEKSQSLSQEEVDDTKENNPKVQSEEVNSDETSLKGDEATTDFSSNTEEGAKLRSETDQGNSVEVNDDDIHSEINILNYGDSKQSIQANLDTSEHGKANSTASTLHIPEENIQIASSESEQDTAVSDAPPSEGSVEVKDHNLSTKDLEKEGNNTSDFDQLDSPNQKRKINQTIPRKEHSFAADTEAPDSATHAVKSDEAATNSLLQTKIVSTPVSGSHSKDDNLTSNGVSLGIVSADTAEQSDNPQFPDNTRPNCDSMEKESADKPQHSTSHDLANDTPAPSILVNREKEDLPTEAQATDNAKDIIYIKSAFQQHLKQNGYHHQTVGVENQPTLEISLENCLSMHTNLDVLDEENKFICQRCTEEKQKSGSGLSNEIALCQVSKQLSIHKLPPVLILHIKRFDLGGIFVTKDNRYVSFSEVLDMAPYCTVDSDSSNFEERDNTCTKNLRDSNGRILYGLYAVVVHHGSSLQSGHYIAYVKERPVQERVIQEQIHGGQKEYDITYCQKGKWYYTSDTIKRQCQFEDVQRSKAYMLFYERLPIIYTPAV
ncbi:ubiquitin carboxyl-terminal hydrolase 16-like isoform X3 [Dysidea avara]|uniref:ubiquitin carboxyl-terminal hydrolase 16-like isoform X3 n=1 Tax=Dysidea avara TaxID=196820 RepID=UPI0033322FDE